MEFSFLNQSNHPQKATKIHNKSDSTRYSPPKNQPFSSARTFRGLARYEEGCYEKYVFTYFLVREGLSIDHVGVAKGTVAFQEIWPWDGLKTGDFVKEKMGGGYRRMTRQCISTVYHVPKKEPSAPSDKKKMAKKRVYIYLDIVARAFHSNHSNLAAPKEKKKKTRAL